MTTRKHRALVWVTPTVVIVELALAASGTLSLSQAVWAFVFIEAVLAVVTLTAIVTAWRRYRRALSAGPHSRWAAAGSALGLVLPSLAVRAIMIEGRAWWALLRRFRRDQLSANEFSYGRELRPLLGMVIGLLVLEGLIVEFVVAAMFGHGWWIWVLLTIHLYALVWIGGTLASFSVFPHRVGIQEVVLRDSIFGEYRIPIHCVNRVRVETTQNTGRSGVSIDQATNSGRLCHGNGNVTIDFNVDADLAGTPVRRLAISLDAPADFVAAVDDVLSASGN